MNLTAKLLTTVTGVTLLAFSTGETAQAAILAQSTFSVGFGVGGTDVRVRDDVNVSLSIGNGFPNSTTLFEGIFVTPLDVGETLTATQATDPKFNNFVASLKGSSNSVVSVFVTHFLESNLLTGGGVGIGAGSTVPLNEASFSSTGAGPIDFSRDTIDSISLHIDSLKITQTDQFATVDVVSTVSIEGVPEPSSSLAAFAVFGAGWVLKRRVKKV